MKLMVGNPFCNTDTLSGTVPFDVSVDYILGEGEHAAYDKNTIRRLQDIENLDPNTKTKIFDIIDTYLRDAKTRQAYGV